MTTISDGICPGVGRTISPARHHGTLAHLAHDGVFTNYFYVMEHFFRPLVSVSPGYLTFGHGYRSVQEEVSRMNSNEEADASLMASDPRILFSDSGFTTGLPFSINWMGLAIGLILLLLCKFWQYY